MAVVNHDYPNAGDFVVVNEDGDPVEDAEIRIYDSVAFQANQLGTWLASTTTDADGKWRDPIDLPDGGSYVVWVQKYSVYGPEHWELTT